MHKTDSKNYDFPLYLAMRKYGKNNFYIEEIEEVDNSLLNEREKYWIRELDSYKNGYNATYGGQEGYCIHSIEEKKLWYDLYKSGLTITEIGKKLKCSTNSIRRELEQKEDFNQIKREHYSISSKKVKRKKKINPICQYDLKGDLIKEYLGIFEIKEKLGEAARRSVQNVLTRKTGTYLKSRWAYKGNPPSEIPKHTIKVLLNKGADV